MMTNYSPFARIALRYIVGGLIMGSDTVGEMLASDPDLVIVTAAVMGAAVEAWYARAKKKGGAT